MSPDGADTTLTADFFYLIIIITIIMSEYFDRIKVSVLHKYVQVKKLLSTLVLRKALK